jgi:hypothetical protein
MGSDLTGFWQGHPDQASEVIMLRALYEKGPCSFCREKAVRRLIELNALTGDLRTECSYDANDDNRELDENSQSPHPGRPPRAARPLNVQPAKPS